MRTKGSWRTNLLLALASIAFASVLAALGGEFVMRYYERHRSTAPGSTALQFYRHRRLVYAFIRNFDYFGWVHVNRQGFRGADVGIDKPRGTLRIMTVGESTTFDRFVKGDEATWPARLQFWLRKLAPERPVEVINAGTPGYRVIDNLIRLETDLYQYRPDIIILYHGHNDLFWAVQQASQGPPPPTDRPDESPIVTPWDRWLKGHSLLYNKIVSRLQYNKVYRHVRLPSGDRSWSRERWDRVLDGGVRQFERDETMFIAVARELGIRVIIPEVVHVSGVGAADEPDSALRAVWAQHVPFAPPEVILAGYRRYDQVLRAVSTRFSVPLVETASFGLRGTSFYGSGDPIHFNNRGADRMGRDMAEALLAARLLDPPAPGPRVIEERGAGARR